MFVSGSVWEVKDRRKARLCLFFWAMCKLVYKLKESKRVVDTVDILLDSKNHSHDIALSSWYCPDDLGDAKIDYRLCKKMTLNIHPENFGEKWTFPILTCYMCFFSNVIFAVQKPSTPRRFAHFIRGDSKFGLKPPMGWSFLESEEFPCMVGFGGFLPPQVSRPKKVHKYTLLPGKSEKTRLINQRLDHLKFNLEMKRKFISTKPSWILVIFRGVLEQKETPVFPELILS